MIYYLLARRLAAVILFLCLTSGLQGGRARAEDPVRTIDDLIRALRQERARVVSVRAEGVRTVHNLGMQEERPVLTHEFVSAFRGDLALYAQRDAPGGIPSKQPGARRMRLIDRFPDLTFYDGEKIYRVASTPLPGARDPHISVNIQNGKWSGNDIRELGFAVPILGMWPDEALEAGRYRLVGREADPVFESVYAVVGEHPREGLRVRLHFAPKHNHLIVYADIADIVRRVRRRWTYRMDKVRQVGGHWVPAVTTVELFLDPPGQLTPVQRKRIEVKDIAVNSTPEDEFRFPLKPGYSVKDSATNTFWVVGPGGERLYKDISGPGDRPRYEVGWLFMASAMSLTLLGIGAVVRWRSRRRPV